MDHPSDSAAPTPPPAVPVPRSRPRLTPTERRAAHYAEIANQQSVLKREAAERRAARDAAANHTN